ncbi:RimK family alpha-L-glutamate ligase [Streptomyces sp. CA-256286]|uniref:RimK family alpha-L-glutamate ligase n=1 Tax=Streptomyces sp. CA-256286 TaxID=2801033 RepID=UPI001A981CC7|nr:RimK family alpha-L-glutamate ligase [Streptomyces sp. CA-256286]QTA37050.1 Glutathione synthetase [Streptomyces sp. CA-256286]QTA37070.1 Glutathione synthetase [Streptomyces sp. CA-256286]
MWLLLGPGLEGDRTKDELAEAFSSVFGSGAVVYSRDLVLGVAGGALTLSTVSGERVVPPAVVYARLSTPHLSTDREGTLLRHLEAMGSALLNPIGAVLSCVNKFWHLQDLSRHGLPVPDTRTYADAPLTEVIAQGVPEPCVVKAVRGNRGEQVFLAPDAALLREVQGSLRDEVPFVLQEYVRSSHGRDLRVIVVDGRVVTALVRTAMDGGMKSNVHQGGSCTPCPGRYPEGEALAVRAAKVLGLVVAGVDLLFTVDGSFTVCEVNANVSWRPEMSTVTRAIVAACQARLPASR